MGLYFRLDRDGEMVYVVKSVLPIKRVIGLDFERRAVPMESEEFLSKIPKVISDAIRIKIDRLKEVKNMKVSIIGGEICFAAKEDGLDVSKNSVVYNINGKKFSEEQREEAEKYFNECYGGEFAEKYYSRVFGPEYVWKSYFVGNQEISIEQYDEIEKEIDSLTNVISLQREQEKNNIRK